MYFLSLLLGYACTCALVILLYMCKDHHSVSCLPLQRVYHVIELTITLFSKFVPISIKQSVWSAYHTVFFARNRLFQVLFVCLITCGHVVLYMDAIPLLYASDLESNHVLVSMVMFVLTMGAFLLACSHEPGVITRHNVTDLVQLYQYDDVMYAKKNMCSTCALLKPARSKHCGLSDECVHRFDHYCVWTNCAIGAYNHVFFLAFIFTLTLTCVNAVLQTGQALAALALMLRLQQASYVDSEGQVHPMDLPVFIQSLFMNMPRLVLLCTFCVLLVLLLGALTSYHVYLALTNQTTNERYKLAAIRRGKPNFRHVNIYDKGYRVNICEFVFPSYILGYGTKKQRR